MNNTGKIARYASTWVAFVQRYAALACVFALLLAAGSGYYAATHIGIDTHHAAILKASASWHRDYVDYQADFPHVSDELIVVIDGENAALTSESTRELAAALRSEPEQFQHVYVPGGGEFFERNALLYLTDKELQALATRLTELEPFVGRLAPDPSLDKFFSLLAEVMQPQDIERDLSLGPILTAISDAFEANTQDEFHRLPWQELVSGPQSFGGDTQRIINLQPVLEQGALIPAGKPMARIRAVAEELNLNARHGVSIRLTGQAAMEAEELLGISSGAVTVALLAFIAAGLILLLALRSLRLTIALLLTLTTGLLCTAGFAALTVGTLNIISAAFAIISVVLGIHFAMHLCLRYREILRTGIASNRAMQVAAENVGASLVISALATSIIFFALAVTEFNSIAALGLVSGLGILITLLVTLTLLPALLALMPLCERVVADRPASAAKHAALPQTRRLPVLLVTAAFAAASATALVHLQFNSDSLDLRNPGSESVQTYRELLDNPEQSILGLAAVVPDVAAAGALSAKLDSLKPVKRAVSIAGFVPTNQAVKLDIIKSLSSSLALDGPAPLPRARMIPGFRSVVSLKQALNQYLERNGDDTAAQRLNTTMEKWNTAWTRAPLLLRQERMGNLQQSLLAGLPPLREQLRVSLNAKRITLDTLPPEIKTRWVDADGNYRVEAFPVGNLDNADTRRKFVDAVRSVAPRATGVPAAEQFAGVDVVRALVCAFTYAVIGIALLLLVFFRSIADVARVLALPGLIALLLAAASVVFEVPFNFANIIVLPLLFGVATHNGIHSICRVRGVPSASSPFLATSTARGVFFSGMTAIVAFGGLVFSQHAGAASAGLLLIAGMLATLLVTLIVLPTLLPSD